MRCRAGLRSIFTRMLRTVAELLEGVHLGEHRLEGDAGALVRLPVNFEMMAEGLGAEGLGWLKPGNEAKLPAAPLALLICTPESREKLPTGLPIRAWLLTDTPRRVFAGILAAHFAPRRPARVEATAIVHPEARLGADVYIGHYVVIEAGCVIGDRTQILHHTVLMEGTEVGQDCVIGCHCTIGMPGFGYENDAHGRPRPLPQVGTVRIGHHVHIHSNTCIDRAALGATVLHDDVAVDNLVHIAHGAVIGERSLVIANAMVAGSARIGTDSWIAPSVNVMNGITLGDRTMTGMGATVVKSAPDDQTLVGSPAEPIATFKSWLRARKRLLEAGNEASS